MNKKLWVAMAMVATILLTAGMAASKPKPKIPNLVGTWSGTVSFVGWNSSGGFYYLSNGYTYQIQNEDLATGNFYGLMDNFYPFTGNVNTNNVVTIVEFEGDGRTRIITATVKGKTMSGTMQHFVPQQIDTGSFTFSKQ